MDIDGLIWSNSNRVVSAEQVIEALRSLSKKTLRNDWVNWVRKIRMTRPDLDDVCAYVKEELSLSRSDVVQAIKARFGDVALSSDDPVGLLMIEDEIEALDRDDRSVEEHLAAARIRAPIEFIQVAHNHQSRIHNLLHDDDNEPIQFAAGSDDPDVRNAIRERVAQINIAIADSLRFAVSEINLDYHILTDEGGKCCVMYYKLSDDTRDPGLKLAVQNHKEFLVSRGNVKVLTGLLFKPRAGEVELIYKELASFWFKHEERRTFEGLTFDPSSPLQSEGKDQVINGHINVWRGLSVVRRKGDWRLMREHIRSVLANGDEASDAYIIKWLTWCVQNPGEVAETAICFVGEQGTGKTSAGRWMLRIFGIHGTRPTSARQVTGNFNFQLRDKCFLLMDEALNPESRAAANVLKGLITDDKMMFEAKGRDPVNARNRLKMMIVSNHDHFVDVELGDRRFAVFRVSKAKKGDDAYFRDLYAEAEQGGIQAMLFDLLEMPLGNWHPRNSIPNTKERDAQKVQSLSGFHKVMYRILDTAMLPVIEDDIEHNEESGGVVRHFVRTEAILDAAKEMKIDATAESFRAMMKSLGEAVGRGTLFDKHRPTKGKVRQNGWLFPPLKESRLLWVNSGMPAAWGKDFDEEWSTPMRSKF